MKNNIDFNIKENSSFIDDSFCSVSSNEKIKNFQEEKINKISENLHDFSLQNIQKDEKYIKIKDNKSNFPNYPMSNIFTNKEISNSGNVFLKCDQEISKRKEEMGLKLQENPFSLYQKKKISSEIFNVLEENLLEKSPEKVPKKPYNVFLNSIPDQLSKNIPIKRKNIDMDYQKDIDKKENNSTNIIFKKF